MVQQVQRMPKLPSALPIDELSKNSPIDKSNTEKRLFSQNLKCLYHLHAVVQVLEKTSEYQIPIYMVIVDYEKAFDSIQHKAVFEALKQHGVEDKYINILKETYKEGTAQVRTDILGRKIPIMKGKATYYHSNVHSSTGTNLQQNQKMPMCLKKKIMDTVIMPTMTNGAETWSITKHQKEMFDVTQRSMERAMLNITRKDDIQNE
ncbi:uncharacterized protein LOC119585806 [Penaeus monodon]|uniref:uncharacterized protein LOC119585806 n=1 Tax=Penaeus monodon TaxID=6687 RepID=UPI0018A74056|nr:uncharacterized protein LOC119585806 [Penaeus monodon]